LTQYARLVRETIQDRGRNYIGFITTLTIIKYKQAWMYHVLGTNVKYFIQTYSWLKQNNECFYKLV